MPFRVSIFSQQQSTKLGGWSINFWNLSEDRLFVLGRAQDLQGAINQAMAAQAFTQSLRISTVPPNRLPLNVDLNHTPTVPASLDNDADYPTQSIQLILTALPNYRATVWLSGIPDTIVSNSGRYVPTPNWTPRVNAVLNLLKDSQNQWGLFVLNRTPQKKAVSGLLTSTGVLNVPNHGWGDAGAVIRIRVTGFAIPKLANKVWRATIIDAASVQLNFWTGLSDPKNSGVNPQAQLQTYQMVAMANAVTGAATKHNRGRPIGLLGGRRRRRQS